MRRICLFLGVLLSLTIPTLSQDSQSLGETARQLRSAKADGASEPISTSVPQPRITRPTIEARYDAGAKAAQDQANQYFKNLRDLLHHEKFDQIDQVADTERSGKTRFPGGGWKLYTLYRALAYAPHSGKGGATDIEWQEHLRKLKRWTSLKPNSITARVGLASAYVKYAWKARGTKYADKVSDEQWRVFGERLEMARTTLQEAATLTEKCPHMYWVMQGVALGQGWDKEHAAELFQGAIAFEPTYQYYYSAHAYYLQPKWYGEEGEAEKFVDEVSSRIGGKAGSILYFDLAESLSCHCRDEHHLRSMSWPRIIQGYADLEEQYGTLTLRLNQMTYMAVKFGDALTARHFFVRLGDAWNEEIWTTKKYFEESREWATRSAAYAKSMQQMWAAAAANLTTPEGRQYDQEIGQEFGKRFAFPMKECVKAAGPDVRVFDVFLELGKKGSVQQIMALPIPVNACLTPKIRVATFTPPPRESYWVKISVNMQP